MKERLAELGQSVSRNDRQQIADYTEAVRNLEKANFHRRREVGKIIQSRPSKNRSRTRSIPARLPIRSNSIGRARILMQLAKLAVQTDSTRVVSIFIRGVDEKPPIPGVSEGHHGLSHHGRNPEKIAQLKIIETLEMTAFRTRFSP